jgi:hypothetical protein
LTAAYFVIQSDFSIANMNTASRTKPQGERGFVGLLRGAAVIAAPVGAAGCVGLTLWSGRRNESRILLVLFALWVLSPFMAVALANVVSKSWSVVSRATLDGVTLVLTLVSLAMYGDVHLRPAAKPNAFVFIVVPAASWLIIAIAVAVAALISGRLFQKRSARRIQGS